MHGFTVYVKEGYFFRTYLQKTLQILTYGFDWFYFTQCLTSFSSNDHLLPFCAHFFILFHPSQTRFSRSTHQLMFLTLEILTSIITTALPILVELIDIKNSVRIFLSQVTLLRRLAFILGSQNVIITVLLFWIYLFVLTLYFHQEILIKLLSQFPLTFHYIYNRMPCLITQLMTILVLIGMVFLII